MKLWCVLVTGLHHSCYECDGGGDADFYFVAAPSRMEAHRLVLEERLGRIESAWELDEERGRADDYRSFAIRSWKGRTKRLVAPREIERAA